MSLEGFCSTCKGPLYHGFEHKCEGEKVLVPIDILDKIEARLAAIELKIATLSTWAVVRAEHRCILCGEDIHPYGACHPDKRDAFMGG